MVRELTDEQIESRLDALEAQIALADVKDLPHLNRCFQELFDEQGRRDLLREDEGRKPMRWIRFRGSVYLLAGTLEAGGAITSPERYSKDLPSFAHLYEDGVVQSFGEPIGTREDVEDLGEAAEQEVDDLEFLRNMIADPFGAGWFSQGQGE